jgi:hypothetical protein
VVTAVLAGVQVAANHWAPLYLLWFAAPAMIALLGPLGASVAAPVEAQDESDAAVPAAARLAPV